MSQTTEAAAIDEYNAACEVERKALEHLRLMRADLAQAAEDYHLALVRTALASDNLRRAFG